MRKLIAMILCVTLLCVSLVASADEQLTERIQAAADTKLASVAAKDTNWTAGLMAAVELVSAEEQQDDKVILTYRYPKVACGVSATEKVGEDAQDFIVRALQGWKEPQEWVSFEVIGTLSKGNVKFEKKKAPSSLHDAVRMHATAVQNAFAKSDLGNAVKAYMIPHVAKLPAKKTADVPDLPSLTEGYAASFAETMGVSVPKAAQRLSALMMLMTVKSVELTKGLDHAVMTVSERSWKPMLASAEKLAMAQLDITVGAPDLTRDDMETILLNQMPQALADACYSKSNKAANNKMAVDLFVAADGNVAGACPELAELSAAYSAEWENVIDRLMASAAVREYYITIPSPDTGILSGKDMTGEYGTVRLCFELGADKENDAWVRVERGGSPLAAGFVGQGDTLTFRVVPGHYTIYYGKGKNWYGDRFLFIENGEYGCFEVDVPDMELNKIALYDDHGPLTVTEQTWEQVTGRN